MRVATIGSDPILGRRRRVLEQMEGVELLEERPPKFEDVDVLFIGIPRSDRFRIAAQAARAGTHVFLEWPPATSIRECAALVRLAEEAGLECGVSRPDRFCPLVESVGENWRANVVAMMLHGDAATSEQPPRLSLLMADAVDLCCALVRSSSVRRVDAEAARDESSLPEAAMFSMRFHSGAYAQVFIRLDGTAAAPSVYASGGGVRLEGAVDELEEALRRETAAFVEAVRIGAPAPVSALDALHTMRIVERLQSLLR